jgi:glycosyltransferase involved in cell wall biosynthesis
MGMGLPVVGYDTGAMSEILGSKKYLVTCGDVEALSAMIVEMMNDQVQRKQTGLANKKRAQQLFGLESMITSYSNLYQSLV